MARKKPAPVVKPVIEGESWAVEIDGKEKLYRAGQKCGNNHGFWFCTSHTLAFQHNFDKDTHISKGTRHRMAWVCFEHGPEVP